MQVLSAWTVGLEISRAVVFERGFVRRRQISRTSEKPGDVLREDVEHLARSFPPGNALGVGREGREISIPCGWQLTPLHLVDLGGEIRMRGAIGIEQVRPLAARLSAARPDPSGKMLADALGNEKLRILGPPQGPVW